MPDRYILESCHTLFKRTLDRRILHLQIFHERGELTILRLHDADPLLIMCLVLRSKEVVRRLRQGEWTEMGTKNREARRVTAADQPNLGTDVWDLRNTTKDEELRSTCRQGSQV